MARIKYYVFAILAAICHCCHSNANIILQEGKISLYSGTINNKIAIKVLLEKKPDNSFKGIYYYEKTKSTIFLDGNIDSAGVLKLKEYTLQQTGGILHNPLDGSMVTGFFEGKFSDSLTFSGNWLSPDRQKSLPCILKEQLIPTMDLQSVMDKIRSVKTDAEFQFLICTQLTKTLSDFDFFMFGGGDIDTSKIIGRAICNSQIFTKNLFENDSAESILALNFLNEQTFLFIFSNRNGTWIKIPDCIWSKSEDGTAHACITRSVSNDSMYFSWHFVEFYKKGEFVIESREYGGRCASFYPRGNDIEYRVIGISRNGIRIIYEELQDHFWYSDARPIPMDNPVQIDFKIVPGEKQEFPKRIRRTEYIFGIIDPDKPSTAEPIDKRISYLELN